MKYYIMGRPISSLKSDNKYVYFYLVEFSPNPDNPWAGTYEEANNFVKCGHSPSHEYKILVEETNENVTTEGEYYIVRTGRPSWLLSYMGTVDWGLKNWTGTYEQAKTELYSLPDIFKIVKVIE